MLEIRGVEPISSVRQMDGNIPSFHMKKNMIQPTYLSSLEVHANKKPSLSWQDLLWKQREVSVAHLVLSWNAKKKGGKRWILLQVPSRTRGSWLKTVFKPFWYLQLFWVGSSSYVFRMKNGPQKNNKGNCLARTILKAKFRRKLPIPHYYPIPHLIQSSLLGRINPSEKNMIVKLNHLTKSDRFHPGCCCLALNSGGTTFFRFCAPSVHHWPNKTSVVHRSKIQT